MEIFQHKLRPSSSQSASSGGGNNDAISLASVSSYSEEVAAATAGHNNNNNNNNNKNNSNDASSVGKQGNSPTPGAASSSSTPLPQPVASSSAFNNSNSNLSRILQGQNQVALNLKANAEQLKGNVKKSLILCGEAQSFNNHTSMNPTSSGTSNSNSSSSNASYYDAIHQNNLGIVYETSGKSHLALHAFSKAVRSANNCSNSNSNARFESDGTARPDVTLHVLNNAAVCALKSRNYVAAYECYAIGLATSNSWRKRPRTWLRLSEACIGTLFIAVVLFLLLP
jgi:tetratricopeptide (TPR) repeat protein